MRWLFFALVLPACSFRPGALAGPGDANPGLDARAAIDGNVVVVDARPDAAIDASLPIDAAPDAPPPIPRDCLDAFQHGVTTDGVVTIDPDGDGGNAPFAAYCDMTTDGGGWTLVWVYGFTDYGRFTYGDNAVTPLPTWGLPSAPDTPTSTTVPLDPATTGALDFPRWASLGEHVLVTSNINHWVECQPGTGSIATLTAGSMSCTIVKLVATACTNVVPDRFGTGDPAGAGLYAGPGSLDTFYFWEGYTHTGNWPTHDPCGNNGANELRGVANPRGRIYLRRM